MEIRQGSSGRVQPTEYRNLIEPATCLLCARIGRDPSEIFASLGVELSYYGQCYLCVECCAEIADFIGYVDSKVVKDYALAYDRLAAQHNKKAQDYARLKELLDARIDAFVSGESGSDGTAGVSLSETESDSDFVNQVIDGL